MTLDEGVEPTEELRKELIMAVREEIGAFGESSPVPKGRGVGAGWSRSSAADTAVVH